MYKNELARAAGVALNQMAEEICHSEEKIEKFIF